MEFAKVIIYWAFVYSTFDSKMAGPIWIDISLHGGMLLVLVLDHWFSYLVFFKEDVFLMFTVVFGYFMSLAMWTIQGEVYPGLNFNNQYSLQVVGGFILLTGIAYKLGYEIGVWKRKN
jgi:hypothetical protein